MLGDIRRERKEVRQEKEGILYIRRKRGKVIPTPFAPPFP